MSVPVVTRWRPPRLWLVLQVVARVLVGCVARLRVTGDVPAGLRGAPVILAANHLSPIDPAVLTAAVGLRGLAPRIMATGGLFRTPVLGSVMRACGHIRVDRNTGRAARALDTAAEALAVGSVVLVYPEGRIGLDPGLWPERGKTGVARLALATGAAVVPVAQWGTHELVPYSAPRGAVGGVLRALLRRPVVRVHLGAPVDLSDLSDGVAGHARQATDRIIDALTAGLAGLRPDEPDLPRHVDPSRPISTARSHRPVTVPPARAAGPGVVGHDVATGPAPVPRAPADAGPGPAGSGSAGVAVAQVRQHGLAGGTDAEQGAGLGDAPVGGTQGQVLGGGRGGDGLPRGQPLQ